VSPSVDWSNVQAELGRTEPELAELFSAERDVHSPASKWSVQRAVTFQVTTVV
jgi:hypothetical protein